ncbi:MAG: hypothetical protein ACOC2W_03430 [bacterium]
MEFDNIFYELIVYIFMLWFPISIIIIGMLIKTIKQNKQDYNIIQQQNIAKIDSIRKEHINTIEKLRVETIKKNDERNKQWAESEKETLHVLNGISNLLDLSEKIGNIEADKIIKKLDDIDSKLDKTESKEVSEKFEEILSKLEILMKKE